MSHDLFVRVHLRPPPLTKIATRGDFLALMDLSREKVDVQLPRRGSMADWFGLGTRTGTTSPIGKESIS